MKTKTKKDLLTEVGERTCREFQNKFIRQQVEKYKQTEDYREYARVKQAEKDKETKTEMKK
jgi:hypothetical protein